MGLEISCWTHPPAAKHSVQIQLAFCQPPAPQGLGFRWKAVPLFHRSSNLDTKTSSNFTLELDLSLWECIEVKECKIQATLKNTNLSHGQLCFFRSLFAPVCSSSVTHYSDSHNCSRFMIFLNFEFVKITIWPQTMKINMFKRQFSIRTSNASFLSWNSQKSDNKFPVHLMKIPMEILHPFDA